jgi:hypothetical protein
MPKKFITVVSGLPRSGTSMMMQILKAGGKPVLTDNLRKKDNENPKGYYEYEPVKKTGQDSRWVDMAMGKAVKMVYKLLYDLPGLYQYRVIMMQRDMREILRSQKKMLLAGDNKLEIDTISDKKMAELFRIELDKVNNWLNQKECFSVIKADYRSIVEDPVKECEQINRFLGGNLDVCKMACVVDSSLYRNKV